MPSEALREFYTRRWSVQSQKVRLETKKELKQHFRRSPDYGDAVAFAVELARRLGAIAGSGQPTKVNTWAKELQQEYDEIIQDEMSFSYQGSTEHEF